MRDIDPDELLDKICPADNRGKLGEFARRYYLDLIIIFGSYAKGYNRSYSDVDVAVRSLKYGWRDGEQREDWEWEMSLMEDLAGVLRGDIDMVVLNRATPLLLFEVASGGIPLYQRDEHSFMKFQSYAARRYDDNQKFFKLQLEYLKKKYGIER